jgi:uncharacterized protein with HEPN domain
MTVDPGKKLLWDAHEAARHIARITVDQSFEDYLANDLMRWAVERQFMIVGEALSVLRRIDPALAGHIPELTRIVGFRNVLVHGYAGVDDSLVWGVIERELPQLTAALAGLLGSAQDPS